MDLRHSGQSDWSETVWDEFVNHHKASHPLQLSAWGRLKREFGWQDLRVAEFQGDRIRAGAQILFRPLPHLRFLPFRIAYIPKGPLLTWEEKEDARAFLDSLFVLARRRGAIFLRIEPEFVDSLPVQELLQDSGLESSPHAIQPRTTLWIDLRPEEEVLLAGMKQKWRYNIRLAGRKGVRVRIGQGDDLSIFNTLMKTTGERNEFGVHTAAYYRCFWEQFSPSGNVELLIAEHESRPLAAIMVVFTGDKAYYLYGASGNEGRHLMPNHLLQWEAMIRAKARGCTAYDMWGIPDEIGLDPQAPIPDPPDGLWGVWRFKQGFGGEIVRYIGAWDRFSMPLLPRFVHRLGL